MDVTSNKNNSTKFNPMDWNQIDRAIFAACCIAPWYFLQAGFGFLITFSPGLVSFLNYDVQLALNYYYSSCGLLWVIVALLGVCLRQRQQQNVYLEWIIILIAVPLIIPIISAHGFLTTSTIPALITVAVLGFFLFDTRRMVITVQLNVVLVSVVALLTLYGYIPCSTLYQDVSRGPSAYWWMAGQFTISLYPLLCGIVMVRFFLEGLQAREEKIRELSRRDGLTNVWNRRYFMEILENELTLTRRYRRPISFIMVDLDYFKNINDQYGHSAGDKALQKTAEALQFAIRNTDTLGRYGGEEFSVVLPNCNRDDAILVSERCRQAIEKLKIFQDQVEFCITASIGVTTLVDINKMNASTIIENADNALYQSKAYGRNRVTVLSE
ncbi:MAG: GGDEF domain-containing protein [Pseudomonadales bacterium]|nr:GGDEF domain-containing protein [Pseudomonadales bacterium]